VSVESVDWDLSKRSAVAEGPDAAAAAADDVLERPKLRGVSHEVAFFVTLITGPLLVIEAPTATARLAVGIYAAGMSALFGVSALFHRVMWGPKARLRMRRLDHSMIFIFIAASYTAIFGLTVGGVAAAVMLAVVWAGALGGVILKMVWLDAPKPLSASLYIGLGWIAIFAAPSLWRSFGVGGLSLVVSGGVSYTLGAVVYARRSPDPVPAVFGYHEIFHAFVIGAAVCHYLVVVFWALPQAA
jgi:hemolysin III